MLAVPLSRVTRKQLLRLGLGIALSGFALWLALRRTSLDEIRDALDNADWRWLPLMVAIKSCVLIVKDLRWRVELNAMKPGRYRHTFRAIGLGYFGNLVLPFKLGELFRVGLLKRHNPSVSLGDALATIAAERAIDGAVLAVMVGSVLSQASVPTWVMRGTIVLLVVMLSVIAVSMLEPVHAFFIRRLPERGPFRLARRVIQALSSGTAVVREPRAFALTAGLTALAWLGESMAFYCGVQALGLPLDYVSVLIVTLLLSIGLLIPSAPGQIGTHQALMVLFLTPFGIATGAAVSLSVVLQASTLTTLGSVGGYVLIREAGARDIVHEIDQSSDQSDSQPAT